MSKNKQKITKSVEGKGYTVGFIKYEPIGKNLEMMGREGGWVVRVDQGEELVDYILGHSVLEVLENISELTPCIVPTE